MRELSLFSGAGGGLLGTKLLGWETIGYVEWNEYCQRVLRARIDDGIFEEAPIFTDVCEFVESGAAQEYRGFADVVTAGFPCQPFSVAGKQAAENDERNMWPATISVIREVRPRFVFLENVPGLLAGSHGYFGRILRDLAESGYDARWRCLSSAEMGAPHLRDRVWILAYSTNERWSIWDDSEIGDLVGGRMENREQSGDRWKREAIRCGMALNWKTPESEICIGCDDVDSRLDRLKAIGNGQVPAVAAEAWNLLTSDLNV